MYPSTYFGDMHPGTTQRLAAKKSVHMQYTSDQPVISMEGGILGLEAVGGAFGVARAEGEANDMALTNSPPKKKVHQSMARGGSGGARRKKVRDR